MRVERRLQYSFNRRRLTVTRKHIIRILQLQHVYGITTSDFMLRLLSYSNYHRTVIF